MYCHLKPPYEPVTNIYVVYINVDGDCDHNNRYCSSQLAQLLRKSLQRQRQPCTDDRIVYQREISTWNNVCSHTGCNDRMEASLRVKPVVGEIRLEDNHHLVWLADHCCRWSFVATKSATTSTVPLYSMSLGHKWVYRSFCILLVCHVFRSHVRYFSSLSSLKM